MKEGFALGPGNRASLRSGGYFTLRSSLWVRLILIWHLHMWPKMGEEAFEKWHQRSETREEGLLWRETCDFRTPLIHVAERSEKSLEKMV